MSRSASRHVAAQAQPDVSALAPLRELGVERDRRHLDVVAERLEQPPRQAVAAARRHDRQRGFERDRRGRQLLVPLHVPAIALLKTLTIATDMNDDAA